MPCTTILVGKNASYDGSTIMARNEDSGAGQYTPKRFTVVDPEEQPGQYRSVLSGVTIDLPEDPMRYTAVPNALPAEGIWGEAGVKEANVAMTETETITSNPRVLGADPLVKGGIGEEDLLTIVLPYIHTAREGVLRLGSLIEEFGTYEMNGIGFQDREEVWWFESIGGHHWIARRVPDDCYAAIPNQLGIDWFDFTDAYGAQNEHLCSADMADFIEKNHLDLSFRSGSLMEEKHFDVRAALGSHDDADHTYNTPRAWFMQRYLNPKENTWDGPDADYRPDADDLPWCRRPEHRITIEDVKYVLSGYYQGTPYDPYGKYGDASQRGRFRPIGINRNNFIHVTQLRNDLPDGFMAVEWLSMGSNAFNALVPFYMNVKQVPDYLSNTTGTVSTDNFYWANRLIGALADAHLPQCAAHIERYQNKVHAEGHRMLNAYDAEAAGKTDLPEYLAECNQAMAEMVRKETDDLLSKVLYEATNGMKNAFSRSDA